MNTLAGTFVALQHAKQIQAGHERNAERGVTPPPLREQT